MSTSYDIRIVSFIGRYWNSLANERLIQVIAEGENHRIVAEAVARTITEAFDDLKVKLERADYSDYCGIVRVHQQGTCPVPECGVCHICQKQHKTSDHSSNTSS